MTKTPDENDQAKAGTLPADPSQGTAKAKLHVVQPGDRRQGNGDPADLEAERALLGALLWAGTNAPETLRVRAVTDILEGGEPFYGRGLGDVYGAILACEAAKAEHDPVAVHAELQRSGKGIPMDALRALVDSASTVSERQARVYAQRIRETWTLRKVILDARELVENVRSAKMPAADLVTAAQALARKAAERSTASAGVVWMSESANALSADLLDERPEVFYPTGIGAVDVMLNGGLRPGEVSIVAARTNVGKSLLAAQICEHVVSASGGKLGALYVTLEMKHKSFMARLAAARSGVPLQNVRRRMFTRAQRSDMLIALQVLAQSRVAFADSPSQTLAAVYAEARHVDAQLQREGKKLGLVVVDHLGLIKPSAEALKKASREQQVAETSRGQRVIAQDFSCHVMGLAQIGREAEREGGSRIPKLWMLRESGAIEQDADAVLILHRERDARSGVFRRDKPAALVLAKGRMDDNAKTILGFDGMRGRFKDPGHEDGDFAEHFGGSP